MKTTSRNLRITRNNGLEEALKKVKIFKDEHATYEIVTIGKNSLEIHIVGEKWDYIRFIDLRKLNDVYDTLKMDEKAGEERAKQRLPPIALRLLIHMGVLKR